MYNKLKGSKAILTYYDKEICKAFTTHTHLGTFQYRPTITQRARKN